MIVHASSAYSVPDALQKCLSFTLKVLLGYDLRFKLFADELVLLGNHRDAWVFGAAGLFSSK